MTNTIVRTKSQAYQAITSASPHRILNGYVFLLRRILQGDTAALDVLGSMLTYGVGVERDLRLAAACYTVASRASYVGATCNLAGALLEGAGIPKDVPKAVRLLRAAARAGDPHALNYLGYCYRVGEGVRKDPRRGFALSLKAAMAGSDAAQYDVGMCLLTGIGVEKDATAAQRWISRAGRGGNRHAQDYLQERRRHRARGGGSTG